MAHHRLLAGVSCRNPFITSWLPGPPACDERQDRRQARPASLEALPRRWVAEPAFARISKHRRTVRDYEHLTANHDAMILWAMIELSSGRTFYNCHRPPGRLGGQS